MRIASRAGFPIALALLAFGIAGPASAVTRFVPQTSPTIAAALAASTAGDTVVVSCGTYFEHGLSLKSGVTLRGATGQPACVTIDAQGLGRVLDAAGVDSTCRVTGLTIQGGVAVTGGFFANGGGGLRAVDSSVRVRDCIFAGNRAVFGGGAGVLRGAPSFTSCVFDSNRADGTDWAAGGGLFCRDAEPVLDTCSFTRNDSAADDTPGDGGGIFSDASGLVATDCSFVANTAEAGAGGFYSYSSDRPSLFRCTFSGNVANAGGAMYLETSIGGLVDCVFEENTAANGGALFLAFNAAPRFEGCTFTSNHATPFGGGAIDAFRGSPEIVGCTFTGNSAGTFGGALRIEGQSALEMQGCFLRGNAAGSQGGGLHVAGPATASVAASTFHANGAPTGGGVYVGGTSSTTIARTIVTASAQGSALACAGSAQVSLVECDLFGNAGGNWVGCIAGQNGTLGNFSADPLYCGIASGVATLRMPDSPCLPENAPGGALVGAFDAGCGCPGSATFRVPDDFPTIAAALAAASPGDVVGVCAGDFDEPVVLKEGVHLVGARADLSRLVSSGSGAPALVVARHVADSTVVADLGIDASGALAHAVLAESTSTGLHLHRNRITGATSWGIVNRQNSRVRLGGELAEANDVFANGGALLRLMRNENAAGDSLDARLNYWGTNDYAAILAALDGRIRSCPITDSTHTKSLCAPLSALDAPAGVGAAGLALRILPNPSRAPVVVAFRLDRPASLARLRLFDVRGRLVRELAAGPRPAGEHRVPWDGLEGSGRPAAPGIYFVRLETPGEVRSAACPSTLESPRRPSAWRAPGAP